MSTGINIAPSSGITVGTTAVTSGTDGRVFFQAGGVVQQDANFIYDNTLKRLGLKAVGTAATDIPLSISNSAGTVNLLQQTGVGSILARSNDTFSFAGLFYRSDGTNGWSLTNSHSGYGQGTGIETVGGSNYILSSGTRALSIQRQSTGTFKTYGIWNYGSDAGQRLLIGENVFDPQFTLSGTGNVGIGTYSGGARLDVRAQGALSTDLAFRVRNSADTANLIEIAGNNTMTFLSSGGKIIFSQDTVGQGSVISLRRDFTNQEIIRLDGTNGGGITINPLNDGSTKSVAIGSVANGISMWSTGTNSHNFQIKNSFHNLFHVVGDPNSATATFRLGTNASNTNFFNIYGRNAGGTGLTTDPVFTVNSAGNFGNGAISFGTNAQFVFAQLNGVAPTTSPTDIYQQYSADIVAGNAAPHFRTENGAIVKVYQETTGVGASTLVTGVGTPLTDTDTFDGYTLKQIVKALRNQGLLA
jgi:hypothetical protein